MTTIAISSGSYDDYKSTIVDEHGVTQTVLTEGWQDTMDAAFERFVANAPDPNIDALLSLFDEE